MNKENRQLVFNAIAILLFIAFMIYGRFAVTNIANTFIEIRKSEEKFLANLVRDNWNGIKSISEKKKQILLDNLSQDLAGADIRAMANICLVLVFALGISLILNSIMTISRIVKTKRHNNALNSQPPAAGTPKSGAH
jgi:TM2 domain-containing membrane protein YozV